MSCVPDSLRRRARLRAGMRCEYCGKPESVSAFSFQADHIIAVKHGGLSELDNLAWACFECNVYKGSDIASLNGETNTLSPLYNPRTQEWAEHFEMDEEGVIKGGTPTGRVTVRLLRFNLPERIEVRRLLLRAGRW